MSKRTMFAFGFGLYALALCVAPLLFKSSLALGILSQIGYSIIICLSYNMLLGQGGMLSFGHAVYTGLGAFFTVHAIQLALPISLVFMPLIGGVAGMLIAVLLGYVSTRKSGTTFAMITLGLGELVAAIALMFPGFFGGEGGISINRTYGSPWFGLSFGPAIQVYYLIAAYCIVCTLAMYGFTRTPLGRMLNAVRDNAERAEFIGYDPQRVRYLAFVLAGFFAGIGGALTAIHLEIVTAADSLSVLRSGNYLLFTFLGGAGFFFGPIIGAVLMVCGTVLLSGLTKAWLLYLGLAFLLMVMYAPGGAASILVSAWRLLRSGRMLRHAARYAASAASLLIALAGGAALVELVYHYQIDGALDPVFSFLGVTLDVHRSACWIGAVTALLIGLALLAISRRSLQRALAREAA